MCRQRFRQERGELYLEKGKKLHAEWQAKYEDLCESLPGEGRPNTIARTSMKLAEGWEKKLPVFPGGPDAKPIATRNAGQQVMNAIADVVPELFGGAADLTSSTKTIFATSRRTFISTPRAAMSSLVCASSA